MIVALYIFLALLAVGAVLRFTDRAPADDAIGGDASAVEDRAPDAAECCGLHAVCERADAAAIAEQIEYFDDEELDAYAGRGPSDYTDDETDQFRDIMLTLPAGEAPLWARSLERRGISLPEPLRDELLMLMGELG